jgi:quercetin dioxygenase-like cupin family protein
MPLELELVPSPSDAQEAGDFVVPDPDSDTRPLAVSTKQVENDRFIVTEWRFTPGAHTGWHRHAFDYVVVPMTTGRLTIETASGTTPAELVTGNAYARQAGVEHDVINDNPHEFVFVEIEVKG